MYAAVLLVRRSSVFKKASQHVQPPVGNVEILVRPKPQQDKKASGK